MFGFRIQDCSFGNVERIRLAIFTYASLVRVFVFPLMQ